MLSSILSYHLIYGSIGASFSPFTWVLTTVLHSCVPKMAFYSLYSAPPMGPGQQKCTMKGIGCYLGCTQRTVHVSTITSSCETLRLIASLVSLTHCASTCPSADDGGQFYAAAAKRYVSISIKELLLSVRAW